MEPTALVTALANAGGLGILAAVLFYLHVTSLKAFREELKAEREQCHVDHEKIFEAINENHAHTLAVLAKILPALEKP